MLEFEKERFINNIYAISKQKGMKIGDLEKEVGLSTGYLSRLKNQEMFPNFDIVIKISNSLNVPIDTLISIDYSTFIRSDKKIFDFVTKLINDTTEENIIWDAKNEKQLLFEYELGMTNPLFERIDKDFDPVNSDDDFYDLKLKSLFNDDPSRTLIDSLFLCKLKELNASIYFLKTGIDNPLGDDYNTQYEMYLNDNAMNSFKTICASSYSYETSFEKILSSLYEVIIQSLRQNKISANVDAFIDDYMEKKKF